MTDYQKILMLCRKGMGNNPIARALGCKWETVERTISKCEEICGPVSNYAKKMLKKPSSDSELFDVCEFTDLLYDDAIICLTGKHLADELSNLSGMLDSYVFSIYLP